MFHNSKCKIKIAIAKLVTVVATIAKKPYPSQFWN